MKIIFLKNNKSGFTLIEMVVAISIFVVVVFLLSEVFSTVLSGQRRSITQQDTQENMRYIYEVIGKEIRQAKRSDTDCYASGLNRVYNTNATNDILYFKNKAGDCVSYFLKDDYLIISRGGKVASTTPIFLKISGLSFKVIDNNIVSAPSRVQPRVTLKMRAESRNQALDNTILYMQTTISSRYYE